MHLEEVQRLGQAAESPGARLLRLTPSGERPIDRLANGGGDHDLAAVRREADPRGGVDREPDVAGLRERGAPAVQPDPQPDVDPPGPSVGVHRALDRERGSERRGGRSNTAKTSSPRADTSRPPAAPDRGAHPTADIGEQGRVLIAEAPEQLG